MRELIEKDRTITVVPADFKCANKGRVVSVEPRFFTIELEHEPDGIMRRNFIHKQIMVLYILTLMLKILTAKQ